MKEADKIKLSGFEFTKDPYDEYRIPELQMQIDKAQTLIISLKETIKKMTHFFEETLKHSPILINRDSEIIAETIKHSGWIKLIIKQENIEISLICTLIEKKEIKKF